jgi:uncharacterized tellurite resistance protein B-like protein
MKLTTDQRNRIKAVKHSANKQVSNLFKTCDPSQRNAIHQQIWTVAYNEIAKIEAE